MPEASLAAAATVTLLFRLTRLPSARPMIATVGGVPSRDSGCSETTFEKTASTLGHKVRPMPRWKAVGGKRQGLPAPVIDAGGGRHPSI